MKASLDESWGQRTSICASQPRLSRAPSSGATRVSPSWGKALATASSPVRSRRATLATSSDCWASDRSWPHQEGTQLFARACATTSTRNWSPTSVARAHAPSSMWWGSGASRGEPTSSLSRSPARGGLAAGIVQSTMCQRNRKWSTLNVCRSNRKARDSSQTARCTAGVMALESEDEDRARLGLSRTSSRQARLSPRSLRLSSDGAPLSRVASPEALRFPSTRLVLGGTSGVLPSSAPASSVSSSSAKVSTLS
mmetsp:Transcript_17321/g.50533  ORF Transcript_17321/g.50533 Transcript_17321/m.50533 type:complete len:253 (-) Transcript_17321:267-1025(-)